MRPVALQELKQLGDGKHWSVEQQLSELDSIGPVKGWLKALHRGDDLWLEAEATATVRGRTVWPHFTRRQGVFCICTPPAHGASAHSLLPALENAAQPAAEPGKKKVGRHALGAWPWPRRPQSHA